MDDVYISVPIEGITIDSVLDFDIYIIINNKYVLYRKANYKIDQKTIDKLKRNDRIIYIEKRDISKYRKYRNRMLDSNSESSNIITSDNFQFSEDYIELYLDNTKRFIEVDSFLFQPGIELQFPLFLQHGNEVHIIQGLKEKSNGTWATPENYDYSDKPLRIRLEDINLYENCIEDFISGCSSELSGNIKTQASYLREKSKISIKNLLDDPRSGTQFNKVKTLMDETVNFVLHNETNFYNLLKIYSYDLYTYTHSINVSTISIGFGSFLGLFLDPELKWLALGGCLHDIGKSQIDINILNKPSRLNDSEFEIVKQHVNYGVKILKETHSVPDEIINIVSQHHEKLSGNGYPNGIQGDDISYWGQIAAIVDCYDALTTKRPYKSAFSPSEALKIMNDTEGDYEKKLLGQFSLMIEKQLNLN